MPEGASGITSFAFDSPTDGLALVADLLSSGGAGSAARLYRTQDGGNHWRLVNQTNPNFGALPLAGRKSQLGYSASGIAWLVITGTPQTPTVFVSHDAGMTWIATPLPAPDPSLVAPHVNVSESDGTIIAVAQWVKGPLHVSGNATSWTDSGGPVPGGSYVLAPGQQTWQVQRLPTVPFGQLAAGFNAGVTWALDRDQVCQVGATNSGCFTPGNIPTLPVDRLIVFDDNTLLGIDSAIDGGAVLSEDGGGSWTTVLLPNG
jgi:hypothetical protein